MNTKKGLTFLEIILILFFVATTAIVFFIQKSDLDAFHRDDTKKSAINALHYALEESYYKDHGYYPEYINPDTLTSIDASNFTDPSGYQLGDPQSSYSYHAADCTNNQCQEYILKTSLEKEATYIKYNN